MHLYPHKKAGWRGLALTLLAFMLAVGGFAGAVVQYDGQNRAREKAQLKASLRRASVACFAVEGRYPPSLSYLKEYYGVHYPEERYWVDYSAFATNVMPIITVLEKGAGP